MASVEQNTPVITNGAAAHTIAVENPATGQLITTVPVLGAEELQAMAQRARQAQPQWEAIGFDGRARIMRRAQKWMLDNADRVLESVVRESGKTYEDAQLADLGYTVTALGLLGQGGGQVPRRRAGAVMEQPGGRRQEAGHPLRAPRRGRGHRALELPHRQLVR